jgi:hypothetical protein
MITNNEAVAIIEERMNQTASQKINLFKSNLMRDIELSEKKGLPDFEICEKDGVKLALNIA